MAKLTVVQGVKKIEQCGILLVYPIQNALEPDSLWNHFFPKKKMRWEWDDSGDDRVAEMWHLRERLSCCRQVVYAKWFKGRATFFSKKLFVALLHELGTVQMPKARLSEFAQSLLSNLDEDSPQSPRMLRANTGLLGKLNESTFNRALKELWEILLIVGFGEIDDGAFPSLAIGSTRLLYEDLWEEARGVSASEAQKTIEHYLPDGSEFRKFYDRLLKRRRLN
jgi:hypothetical protein